jgi:hypothetical protein
MAGVLRQTSKAAWAASIALRASAAVELLFCGWVVNFDHLVCIEPKPVVVYPVAFHLDNTLLSRRRSSPSPVSEKIESIGWLIN